MVFKICHDRAGMSPVQRIRTPYLNTIICSTELERWWRLDRKQNLNARAFAVLQYCSNSLQQGEPPNGMKPLMPKTSQASSVGWQPRYECTRSNPSARSLRPSPHHHHDYARATARVAQRCPPDHCRGRDAALERRPCVAGREGLRPVVTLPAAGSKHSVLLSQARCGLSVYRFATFGLDSELLIGRSKLPIAPSRCLQIACQALELLGAISKQHRSWRLCRHDFASPR